MPTVITGGSGITQNGAEFYHQSNVVGDVSEETGSVTGAVIESGENANGRYIKFADGALECFKTITGIGPIGQSIGSLYQTNDIVTPGDWPISFLSEPNVTSASANDTGGLHSWSAGVNKPGENTAGTYVLFRASANQGTTFKLYITAKGRWF